MANSLHHRCLKADTNGEQEIILRESKVVRQNNTEIRTSSGEVPKECIGISTAERFRILVNTLPPLTPFEQLNRFRHSLALI